MDEFARRLVPEGLWEITEPLIPDPPKRAQGGGIQRVDDRQVFAAVVFVLTTGCAWRHLPPTFGVSHQTTHRRFTEWSQTALWAKLHADKAYDIPGCHRAREQPPQCRPSPA